MTDRPSTLTHQFGMAMLPMGVAIMIVVLFRSVLMATGVASANPVEIVLVLGTAFIAAVGIRSGREYRRMAG